MAILNSMIVYRSFFTFCENGLFTEKEELEFYRTLYKYGLDGVEPETNDRVSALFETIRPTIDRNIRKYFERIESQRYTNDF